MYKLKANGKITGVYFSLGNTPSRDPNVSCSKAICDLFNIAKVKALVSIYSLTEKAIIESMIAAHRRGVVVIVVVDRTQAAGKTMTQCLDTLEAAGIKIHVATKQKACMHNKVGIFDSKFVVTGSYNWTSNATKRNDENLVVIEGEEVATIFEKYVFERVIQNETLCNSYKNIINTV